MHMQNSGFAHGKSHGKGSQIAVNFILSLSISVVSTVGNSLPAHSQVAVGLGISLGTMVLSGLASRHSRHQSPRTNQRDQAIDAYNRGVKLFEKHEYEPALDAFSKALEIDPNMVEAHWNSAISYSKLEEYDKCLAETLIVMEKRKHDAQALFMAAEACQHMHKFAEADQYYQKYLSIENTGVNAEVARRAIAIIENNFLGKPDGDYLADATKGGSACWPSSQMPLKVFIQEDLSVAGYIPEFSTTIKDAFSEWANVSDGKISFVFTDKQLEANITCSWTGDKMQLGSAKELGLTQTARRGDKIMSANIALYTLIDKPDLKREQRVAESKEVDLHEIGHALGLEHSSQPYDTMYFETTPDGLEFALTPRDKKTILALYGNSSPSVSQSLNPRVHSSSVTSLDGNGSSQQSSNNAR